jgi:hypothetical protein
LRPAEAKEFMQLLEARRKSIETAELAVRIEALEGAAAEGAQQRSERMGFVGGAGSDPDLAARVRRLDLDEAD